MPEFELKPNRIKGSGLLRPVQSKKADSRYERATNPLAGQKPNMGNQASLRFAQSCPLSLPSPSVCPFGGVCHACPAKVQAKLMIGRPNDKYEQEADRVAEQVMSMPEPRIKRQIEPEEEEKEEIQPKSLAEQITPMIQKQTQPEEEEKEEEEEPIQAKLEDNTQLQRQAEEEEEREEEEEESIQTKQKENQTPTISPNLQSRINSLKGSGQSLPATVRNFFEPRFGYNFNQVRIHTSACAVEAARAMNAQAFTIGSDIGFRSGRYNSQTKKGRHLLSHELVHVIQQKNRKYSGRNKSVVKNDISPFTPKVQRLTNPLSDMSAFQSPGSSGWRGAVWGCYRTNCTRKHKGWDINASVGTECKAVVAGTISHASEGSSGYGDYVVLTNTADATKKYIYAHLGARESPGSKSEGDEIGEVGTSGSARSRRPHLHYTVMEGNSKVDPDGKGFTKPTKVIEATGSTASTINYSEAEPCTPCSM